MSDLGLLDAAAHRDKNIPEELKADLIYSKIVQGKLMLVYCSQFGKSLLKSRHSDRAAFDGTFNVSAGSVVQSEVG
jgi:hypothetical protein